MKRLAFVLSQFPEMHETFILREFLEFARQGIQFDIYSLKSCRDPIVHPEVESLMQRVHYSRFLLSWQLLTAQWTMVRRRPGAYFGALGTLLRDHWREPVSLVKSLIVFPKIVRFARGMRNDGVTHIHAHWATVPTTAAALLSRLTEVPFSFTAHAWDIHVPNPGLPEKLQSASFVITCTDHNKDYLESLQPGDPSSEIHLNYHGIDLNSFVVDDAALHSRNQILSIGRMVEQKGFEWLLRAIRLVLDQGREVHCKIVGHGPGRDSLRTLIDELELGPFVSLLGPQTQDQIRSLYRQSGMFVLPCVVARNNDRDGIPNVIVEAMASGLPVLSSRVSGIPELVVHEETGLLAEPKDAAGVAAEMISYLEDDELWRRMRTQGRLKIEEMFDVTRNVGRLIDHFRRHGAIE